MLKLSSLHLFGLARKHGSSNSPKSASSGKLTLSSLLFWDTQHRLLAPKKDGHLRFCISYRKLNTISINDMYRLPRIDELIDSFRDVQ